MKRQILSIAVAAGLGLASTQAFAGPITSADIGIIVDESGSMGGEHAFIGPAMQALDAGLIGAGVTGNQFGLVGFGASNPAPIGIDDVARGNDTFMTSADFNTATGKLVLNGSTEDGYAGIDYFFGNYALRPGAATNIILITDEDRDDITGGGVTKNTIATLLASNSALLNAIVDASFDCGDGTQALGIDSKGTGFVADGAGGFTTCTGGVTTGGFGNTETDYVDLALASGGAAWDLNQLRAGGLTADSFTAAFLDIKVEEITEQVPEPSVLAIMSTGLLGLGFMRRRAKKA